MLWFCNLGGRDDDRKERRIWCFIQKRCSFLGISQFGMFPTYVAQCQDMGCYRNHSYPWLLIFWQPSIDQQQLVQNHGAYLDRIFLLFFHFSFSSSFLHLFFLHKDRFRSLSPMSVLFFHMNGMRQSRCPPSCQNLKSRLVVQII